MQPLYSWRLFDIYTRALAIGVSAYTRIRRSKAVAWIGAAFHSPSFAQQYSASGEHDQPAAMLRSPHPPSTLSAVRHSSGQHEALHFNCPHHFVQLLCTQHTFYISLFVPCTHIIFHGLTPYKKNLRKQNKKKLQLARIFVLDVRAFPVPIPKVGTSFLPDQYTRRSTRLSDFVASA